MTIEECYAHLGSNYDEVLRRFGTADLVAKFLLLLPKDESYAKLCAALREKNGEEAFRSAHSLKGICMNLGLESLYHPTYALTEELRGRKVTEKAELLFCDLKKEYGRTLEYIKELA